MQEVSCFPCVSNGVHLTKASHIKASLKNLLMPLFLMGCFPVDFQEVKRPLRTKYKVVVHLTAS